MKQLTARVYPAIGNLRLDKITGRHIQQFINDLINSTSERTGRPLARKAVIHHLSFISDVFSYAVKLNLADALIFDKKEKQGGEKAELPA